MFQNGHIFIELQNNTISFVAGQLISGMVHVNQTGPCFAAPNLTVGLYGSENVFFRKRHRQGKRTVTRNHFGYFPIVSMVFQIASFPDGPPMPGQTSYPFTLQIPEWLPASMMLGGDHESAQLSIQYSIRAQFTPQNVVDWADPHKHISSFKGTRMIYVYRPSIQNPPKEFKFKLKSEVGGFIGINTSEAHTEVFFDKNQYYLGEKARIRMVCDNTKCRKDI